MSKMVSVQDLADEAGLEWEEALLAMWDVGLERLEGASDGLFDREVKPARAALGLPQVKDLTSRKYWRDALGLTEEELDQVLNAIGIRGKLRNQRLPRGSVKRLRAHFRGLSPAAKTKAKAAEPVASPSPQKRRAELLEWTTVGHEAPIRYLGEQDILDIHFAIAEEFIRQEDPIFPAGVRDETLFGSAIARPHTSLGGVLKYPTIEMAAAALLHGLVMDHPFYNGNKRTGLVSMLVFLDENGFVLTCTEKELFRFVLRLARHGLTEVEGRERTDQEVLISALWLVQNARAIEKMERTLQWRQLKKVLTHYGCTFDFLGRDNCLTISRKVTRPARFFGSEQVVELRKQATFLGDGQELSKQNISSIRHALELDDEHGVDSRDFYNGAGLSVDAWINRYRQTLRRLAKL